MEIVLWILQALLGVGFIAIGFSHATRVEEIAKFPRMRWIADVPPRLMNLIGLLEMAGGVGVILPALTGIWPWLTAWAATGLALIMLFAAIFHLVRREYPSLLPNAVLFALAALVAYGRFSLFPF